MTAFQIDFEPVGRRGECSEDQSLLDSARRLNVDLASICGGMGSCARCKVQVVAGQVSELTADEKNTLTERELAQGYRLACKTFPRSDVRLYVPPESLTAPQRTQVEGLHVEVRPDPLVRGFDVQLTPPTLEHPRADDAGLAAALAAQHHVQAARFDLSVLQTLSPRLRDLNWRACVALRGDEVVAIDAPGTRWLGLAVDIGTTKIAGYLVDLASGQTLASQGLMNPQISYGEDVVTRIDLARRLPEDATRLQELLSDALNQMAADLCAQINARTFQIVEAVVVGNTAMHHLFLRLPVQQLGLAPYVPAAR
ncbi:MAG: 2Fe-2S iron-sulfur cluster-binding protein, partial [Chloroflexota bacterium]